MPRMPRMPRTPRDRRSVTARDLVALVLAALWCAAEIAHAYAAYVRSG
ncbi:hypothetical protein J421_1059 [Gemmatirosa kalamazoonensis]|uniref:Uncharacterized protein n=1 Tax=Gemmatirosa kalamazoonensis TaxID=861299 RepID=W0RCR8_9BACT|nr:hypothetical protein [Gemmatirosa kalamazoonensis]AHG88596.1 hypothetical protein J421_1059 [Gemmatirosa kalamazoonensis]